VNCNVGECASFIICLRKLDDIILCISIYCSLEEPIKSLLAIRWSSLTTPQKEQKKQNKKGGRRKLNDKNSKGILDPSSLLPKLTNTNKIKE